MKTLPNFDLMAAFYPGAGFNGDAVKKMIGGSVDQAHYKNTCIIRVSRALNLTGHFLPRDDINGFRTKLGIDKKWYGLRVTEFWEWMNKTYGQPYVRQADTIDPTGFSGLRGINGFRVGFKDATGHFTLWNGSKLLYDRGFPYFEEATEAALWVGDTSRHTIAPA